MEASSAVPYGSDLVRDELHRATETGERRSREELRVAAALGAGDLEEALSYLREQGEVSEVAPDEFELIAVAELDPEEMGGHRVDVGVVVPGTPRPPGAALHAQSGRPFAAILAGETTVKLTRGIADVLDEATLGAIVKAGIAEAGDSPFRLEVV